MPKHSQTLGQTIFEGGFLFVEDLLKHRDFSGVTEEQIQCIVDTNDKKRFTLEIDRDTGKLKICANQGHSLQVEDLDLKPITDASSYPVVVHGTNERCFGKILQEGLKPMGRNHVHFAPGEPGEDGVISGMRNSCTVVIYLNLQKAMQDGLKFYLSANNVILCSGNKDGVIPPGYFDKVKNRRSGQIKYFESEEQPQGESLALGISSLANGSQVGLSSPTTTTVTADDLAPGFSSIANSSQVGLPPTTTTSVTADDLADEFDNQKKSRRKKKSK